MAGAFGIAGYLLMKVGCEPAPLLLGFVLGPMMEENLRRSLFISQGDVSVFVTRPICLALLLITAAAFAYALLPAGRRRRKSIETQEAMKENA